MASPAAYRGSVSISYPAYQDPAYNPFNRDFDDVPVKANRFSLSELHHGTVLLPHVNVHATLHSLNDNDYEELRWEDVEAFLSLSDKFESLSLPVGLLSRGGWWDETLKTLARQQCQLPTLKLRGHQLSRAEVESLADFLCENPNQIRHLRKLSLSSCDVQSEEDGRYLVEALQSPHCHLQALSCHNSPNFIKALLRNNGLAHCSFSFLELYDNISEDWFAILSKGLPRSKLTALRLSRWTWAPDYPFHLLAEALKDPNCGLQELYLDRLSMGDKEVEMLTRALRTSNSKCKLKALYLTEKWIGANSVQYLRDALIDPHCELQVLSLQADLHSIPSDYIAEALESGHCRLLGLSLHGHFFIDVLDQRLLKALCSPNCMLRSIRIRRGYFPERVLQLIGDVLITEHSQLLSLDMSSHRRSEGVCEKSLIAALEKNFKLTTLLYNFADGNLRARCSVLVERNCSLAKGGLQQQNWVRPQRARMFICGHPRVGKTTLRKGLQKVSRRHSIMPKVVGTTLSSCLGREETSTRGIEVEALSFGKDKIVLYDLAGQKEYHAFHHLFVGGYNKDMFVIVCKHDGNVRRNQDDIESKLRYWLRFIVSHSSVSSSIKPHVIVVLNFFNSTYADNQMKEVVDGCTKNLLENEGFGMVLDFGEGNRNIFGIDARRTSHLGQIYINLEPMLLKLLDEKTIPRICNELSSVIVGDPIKPFWFPLKPRKAKPFLLSYSAVVKRYSEDFRREENDDTFDAALNELHNTGQIVYFRTQVEREKQIIISDCGQFCHKLVGALLEPNSLRGEENLVLGSRSWLWKQEDIKDILRNAGQCDDHLHGILSYLEKLELLYRVNQEEFLVPALLGEETLCWPPISNEATYRYIGRRLECVDEEKTLLPLGIFSRLQVRIHNMNSKNKSYQVGYGWISYSDDMVTIILRYGELLGCDKWEEKRWIDIMVRYPTGSRDAKAFKILECIKDVIFKICAEDRGCRGVSLVESVLREQRVKDLGVVNDDFVPLSTIWDNVQHYGFEWSFSWSDQYGSMILDLMTESEVQGHVDKQALAITHIEHEFCVPNELGCVEEQSVMKLKPFGGIEKPSEEFQVLWEWFIVKNSIDEKRHEDTLHAICDVRKDIFDVRKDIVKVMRCLEEAQEKILSNCSNHLIIDLLEGQLPAFPYLCDENGRWKKLSDVAGKRLQLHLMCESPRHVVKKQAGVAITILPEWLVSIAPVLLPALQVLCCTSQLIASAYLPFALPLLNTTQCLLDIGLDVTSPQQSNLPQTIKAFVSDSMEIEKKLATMKKVEKCEWGILGKLLEGKNIDMESDFGLFKVDFGNKVSWVCKDHIKHGIVLKSTGDPFQMG